MKGLLKNVSTIGTVLTMLAMPVLPLAAPLAQAQAVCDTNVLGTWSIANANFVWDVAAPSNQNYFYIVKRDPSLATYIEKYDKSVPGGAAISSIVVPALKMIDVSPATGEIFYPDTANLQVQVYDSAGTPSRVFGAGNITSGANGVKLSPDGALAFVSHGNTGGLNTGNVRVFDATSGTFIGQMSGQIMNGNTGVAVSPVGSVFSTDNFSGVPRVNLFDSAYNLVDSWNPSVATAFGVALNSNNEVYVTGASSTVVNKFDGAPGAHALLSSWSPTGLQTKGIAVDASNNDVYVISGSGSTWTVSKYGCVPTPTPTPPVGDYKDILTFTLQTLGQGPASFTGIGDSELRVFDISNPAFTAAYGAGFAQHKTTLDQIYNGGIGQVSSCETDSDGACTAIKAAAGDYLVVGQYVDASEGKTVYVSKNELAADFNADKENFADLKIIKKFKANAFDSYGPAGQVVVVDGVPVASASSSLVLIAIFALAAGVGIGLYARNWR